MNRAVVRRTAAGLAAHLAATVGPGATVVVGRDARHGSEEFQADVGAVLAGAGVRALLLPRDLPTPVLAFAVLHLGADAGVMVTASHNPPADNGMKVYLADGAQLPSPVDEEVEARIAAVPSRPRPAARRAGGARRGRLAGLPRRRSRRSRVSDPRDVRVAYTPMHGVGLETLLAAFERAGFAAPDVVAEQAEPDPDFPTVAFPNPEEPGALDLLLGCRPGADVAIASDPDADRIAVPSATGRCAATRPVSCSPTTCCPRACAAGSPRRSSRSSMLAARRRRLRRALHRDAHRLQAPRPGRRRPGLRVRGGARRRRRARRRSATRTACPQPCSSPSWPPREGPRTHAARPARRAQERYGVHETRQLSYRVDDLSLIAAAVDDLRASPPASYGPFVVTAVEQPADDVLVHRLDGGRVVVRPTGTEPKLKAYLELVDPAPGAMDALAAGGRGAAGAGVGGSACGWRAGCPLCVWGPAGASARRRRSGSPLDVGSWGAAPAEERLAAGRRAPERDPGGGAVPRSTSEAGARRRRRSGSPLGVEGRGAAPAEERLAAGRRRPGRGAGGGAARRSTSGAGSVSTADSSAVTRATARRRSQADHAMTSTSTSRP